jgi:sugar O-acyltransferase (sialic acid O-acetyltransferase NeuD family)
MTFLRQAIAPCRNSWAVRAGQKPPKLQPYYKLEIEEERVADNDIFVFGASDHARVIIDIIELVGKYKIVGLFDSYKPKGYRVGAYEVLGDENDLIEASDRWGLCQGIIGVGDNATRMRIGYTLRTNIPEMEFVTAVHPSATLSRTANLGQGVLVMAKCYVGLNTEVGEGAVIATNSIFEHDGVMGAYATLGAGTTTGGHVTLGAGTAVCLGCTIIHGMTIGKHTVIGSGSTVINDIPSGVVAYGSPARVIRSRDSSDSYLHIRSGLETTV